MGWKIYFVVFAIILLRFFLYIPFSHNSVYDLIDVPISIITLVGLYGYSFKKRILLRRFWAYWLFITVVWRFSYTFFFSLTFIYTHFFDIRAFFVFFVFFLIPIIIRIPLYIALYLYAFRSKDLWDRDKSLDQISSQPDH
jgi:hypothetical protein